VVKKAQISRLAVAKLKMIEGEIQACWSQKSPKNCFAKLVPGPDLLIEIQKYIKSLAVLFWIGLISTANFFRVIVTMIINFAS
jgi:hypothetical protein